MRLATIITHYPVCRNTAAIIGLGYILQTTLREVWTWIRGFRAYFLAPIGIGRTNLKKYGSWAVVTGASDGIGKGYALELARQGLNVVLISRTEGKLEALANEIKSKYGTEVIVIVADFTEGAVVLPAIAEKLEELDIGILINNVGLSYIHPEYFLEVTKERHRQIIEINCQCMVQMTHLILPKMLKKSKGIVVNLSSMSDKSAAPLLATYGASKIFIKYFTDVLRCEYTSKGVIFQTVASGMVTTAMSNARKVTFFTPDPVTYSRAAVATIGIQNYTHGYWPHALMLYPLSFVPPGLRTYLFNLYLQRSRRILLRRKAEGTLVSQLQQQSS